MKTKTLENNFEVKEGRTITVPHLEDKVSFVYPDFKGTYENVASEIDKAGAKRPNSAETASLVYEAWKTPEEQYSKEIISILKNNWLWEFTGNLYLPKSNEEINNGVILDLDSQNLKFENGRLVLDKNSLVKRLKENDPLVKFVPFGYKTESQTWQELAKNEYIKERYGKEGAEKISEVASKYENNPHIWSFNYVDEEKTRISALYYGWGFNYRLNVLGNYWVDVIVFGRAFGVCKDTKLPQELNQGPTCLVDKR